MVSKIKYTTLDSGAGIFVLSNNLAYHAVTCTGAGGFLFTGGIFSGLNAMLRVPLFLFVLFTRFLFHNELVEVIEYDVMDEVGAMSQPQLLTIDSIYYSPRIKMLSALRG